MSTEFEDAVARLVILSQIQSEVRGQLFEMHWLVQLSIQQWLKRESQLEKWAKESRHMMEKTFSIVNNLGLMLDRQGKYEEANEKHQNYFSSKRLFNCTDV